MKRGDPCLNHIFRFRAQHFPITALSQSTGTHPDEIETMGYLRSRMDSAMKQQLFALSLGFGGLILATHHAFAEGRPNCAERETVVAELAGRYGETRRGIGLAANNAVMEVFASAETGTWTITVTLASGVTCLVASGQNYETLAEQLPATDKGA